MLGYVEAKQTRLVALFRTLFHVRLGQFAAIAAKIIRIAGIRLRHDHCRASLHLIRINKQTILEQGLEKYAAVVDLGVAQVNMLRLPHVIRVHVAEVNPGRVPIALVQIYGQHAQLEVHREPVGYADEALPYLDGILVVLFAERLGFARLQHVPHAHILVRVFGDHVAFIV